MASLRVRKGDQVEMIGGKDRGQRGEVLKVDPIKQRVWVKGLNTVKRHEKNQQVQGAQRAETVGGIVERERSVHISNVALIDPDSNKRTRVGVTREDGKRKRVARRSGKAID